MSIIECRYVDSNPTLTACPKTVSVLIFPCVLHSSFYQVLSRGIFFFETRSIVTFSSQFSSNLITSSCISQHSYHYSPSHLFWAQYLFLLKLVTLGLVAILFRFRMWARSMEQSLSDLLHHLVRIIFSVQFWKESCPVLVCPA